MYFSFLMWVQKGMSTLSLFFSFVSEFTFNITHTLENRGWCKSLQKSLNAIMFNSTAGSQQIYFQLHNCIRVMNTSNSPCKFRFLQRELLYSLKVSSIVKQMTGGCHYYQLPSVLCSTVLYYLFLFFTYRHHHTLNKAFSPNFKLVLNQGVPIFFI